MTTQPPNAADVQAIVEQRLNALSSSLEARQTATIEWRGRQTYVEVIDMPVDLLNYNPSTHRVRAQKTLDPGRERELDIDPFGQAAQDYLHYLLKGDPEDPSREDPTFAALRESLAQHGQEEPGIITRAGVLVNGNTRCAALRELNREHIRVGVLPTDAGEDDVRGIELSLQLRKEHKRDYSFVNFLLAIDEARNLGRTDQDILASFRIRQSTLDRARWILEVIREAIERSRTEASGGLTPQMRLVDFESHQGKLEELYRAYISLKPRDPNQAEALREQRMLALILEKSKTDLRLIDANFLATYLPERVSRHEADGGVSSRTIPGTTIPVPDESDEVVRLRRLTDEALKARAIVIAGQGARPEEAAAASEKVRLLTDEIDGALDKAGKNARIRRRVVAPADRVSDAVEDLDMAVQAIAQARASSQFSAEDVEDALVSLGRAIERLAQQVDLSRGDSVGDGVHWLLRAAALGKDN